MITLSDPTGCCGCGACASACPHEAISLREDAEGFLYPHTDADRCTRCGICARVCPMGSIRAEDCTAVEGICIKCQACIRSCPAGAKYFDDPAYLSHLEMLRAHYAAPAESAYFDAVF